MEKIIVGNYVSLKTREGVEKKGMVRRILREGDYPLVELLDGTIGTVKRIVNQYARNRAIEELRKKVSKDVPAKNEVEDDSFFKGETDRLEYKSSALWSQDLTRQELEKSNTPEIKKYGNRASKIILAKTIAGFLNSEGGNLLIGIQEQKNHEQEDKIVGIEREYGQLKNKDRGIDGYKRMILDDIIKPYFPKSIFHHFARYLAIKFIKRDGKTICNIDIKKSGSEVFVTIQKKDYFYIRIDTETREIQGKQMLEYIRRHWR